MSIAGRNFVGKFQLVRQVGVGGSCSLWDAIDSVHGGRYVLKMLQQDHRDNKELAAQLKNEFLVGKDLVHANIIGVFEFGHHRDLPYVVLESFRGSNLKQIIRENPDWLAYYSQGILEQTASGLSYLHQQGWVHRDVKPDNLLVDEQGHVKIIDFSLARREKKGLGRFLSGKGKVQGTRSYISPEQIRGEPADRRSDIYGFGCMMFELIGGKPPFSGVNSDELLNKHLKARPPSVAASNQNATSEVADLISRLLAKAPDQRPQTMEDFLEEFHATRVYRRAHEPPAPRADES